MRLRWPWFERVLSTELSRSRRNGVRDPGLGDPVRAGPWSRRMLPTCNDCPGPSSPTPATAGTGIRSSPVRTAARDSPSSPACPTTGGHHDGLVRPVSGLCPRVRRSGPTAGSTPQPIACPNCGPRLELVAPGEDPRYDEDALAGAHQLLEAGAILAVERVGRIPPGLRRIRPGCRRDAA